MKEHELRKKDLEAKVSEMESEKAKMLKILSESFSQQQQTVITPVDVMGLVNFILQNGAVDGQIQSDISSTNIQIQTEPPTPNTFNVAGMNCTQTTSDFNIQTGESFRGHLSHELCDLEGRGSADLSCCSDFEMAQCSNNFVFNHDFLADDYWLFHLHYSMDYLIHCSYYSQRNFLYCIDLIIKMNAKNILNAFILP